MSAWVHAEALPIQVYSTAIGEHRRVVIADAITAHLNTDTGLVVTNPVGTCDVALNHGEALFAVDLKGGRLLRVVAGDTMVSSRAGTFSVHSRDARTVDLLVSTGQVAVGTILVSERTFVRISGGGMQVRELSESDVARRLGWTDRAVTFSGETLSEAAGELNRYNTQKLVIDDRTIRSFTVGGKFSTTDVKSFVEALRPLGVRPSKPLTASDGIVRLVGAREAD